MTTSDIIGEFFREHAPGLVRDIVRKEMSVMFGKVHEKPSAWVCTWCKYKNLRFNAGMDHCSVCGAETLTYFVASGELRVKFSRNPKQHQRPRRFTASSKTTYSSPDGRA